MVYHIFIDSLSNDEPTEFDRTWLVEYDPTRYGVSPGGEPMMAHVVTSLDRNQAMSFPSVAAAIEKWRESFGLRQDGQPNRPLTAFSVQVLPEDADPI